MAGSREGVGDSVQCARDDALRRLTEGEDAKLEEAFRFNIEKSRVTAKAAALASNAARVPFDFARIQAGSELVAGLEALEKPRRVG